jgi:hypothetical protein
LIAAITRNGTAKGTSHRPNLRAIVLPVQRPWISNPTPATSQSKAKNNLTAAGFIQVPAGRRPIFGKGNATGCAGPGGCGVWAD